LNKAIEKFSLKFQIVFSIFLYILTMRHIVDISSHVDLHA
jgi:hypothetical protein